MGEAYVSLQRHVLIRACDHGCGHVCVLSESMITLVRVSWLEQQDGLYVGAPEMHPIIDLLETACMRACALTEVHALGCSVARHVVFSQLIVCVEPWSQVQLLLQLTVKQK